MKSYEDLMANILKFIIYVSSVIIITEVIFNLKKYFLNKYQKRKSKLFKANKSLTKKSVKTEVALFFPDHSHSCPYVYREDFYSKQISFKAPEMQCKRPLCKFIHFSTDPKRDSPLRRMIQTLCSAKKSLEVCQWVFTLEKLADICIDLHNMNVCVRVVIDSREDETTNTQISRLKQEGIGIRYGPRLVNHGMFHHKFAIIDHNILMTGSMNWTRSAVMKNYENVLITSKPVFVSSYLKRFNYYWNSFSSVPTNIRNADLMTFGAK